MNELLILNFNKMSFDLMIDFFGTILTYNLL
jgi:hypothetical protein